jgi:hypothetical protein
MNSPKLTNMLLLLIAIGLWVGVLQSAGVIAPSAIPFVRVKGQVDVGTVDVRAIGPVDVNLDSVVGYQLVKSVDGMEIGVNSTDNKVIPIHWGEVTLSR